MYEPWPRRAAQEAWAVFIRPITACVVLPLGAALAYVSILVANGRSTGTQAWIGAALFVAPAVVPFALLFLIGSVRPIRKHWGVVVEDLTTSLIFNLDSLHNHQPFLWEVRLRVDRDDGVAATVLERALATDRGDRHWFQYPRGLEGVPFVRGHTYTYVWSVNRIASGPWHDVARGEVLA